MCEVHKPERHLSDKQTEIAHGCSLTVIAPSDLRASDLRGIVASVSQEKFGVRHERFDLLCCPGQTLGSDYDLIVADVKTSIGLHHAECLLVVGWSGLVVGTLASALGSDVRLRGRVELATASAEGCPELQGPMPFFLTCMDWRLHTAVLDQLIKPHLRGSSDYGLIAFPGVARSLTQSNERREQVVDRIARAVEGGLVGELTLLAHDDCGGYGGHAAFSSEDEEGERLMADLYFARRLVQERCPYLAVRLGILETGHDAPTGLSTFD
jgi:hypothetical protein